MRDSRCTFTWTSNREILVEGTLGYHELHKAHHISSSGGEERYNIF